MDGKIGGWTAPCPRHFTVAVSVAQSLPHRLLAQHLLLLPPLQCHPEHGSLYHDTERRGWSLGSAQPASHGAEPEKILSCPNGFGHTQPRPCSQSREGDTRASGAHGHSGRSLHILPSARPPAVGHLLSTCLSTHLLIQCPNNLPAHTSIHLRFVLLSLRLLICRAIHPFALGPSVHRPTTCLCAQLTRQSQQVCGRSVRTPESGVWGRVPPSVGPLGVGPHCF